MSATIATIKKQIRIIDTSIIVGRNTISQLKGNAPKSLAITKITVIKFKNPKPTKSPPKISFFYVLQ